MNGGTRMRDGETLPFCPVNSACVAIGFSSPAPPRCCSGDVDVWVGAGVAAVAGLDVPVLVWPGGTVALGGGAKPTAPAPLLVPLLPPPPPPQPASASSASQASAALDRMALTGLEDHDVRGRVRLDVGLEGLIVGL